MNWLRTAREARGFSQRQLAARAGVSFRTLQLVESGRWDPKLSTVRTIVAALGYPDTVLERGLEAMAVQSPDSAAMVSERMADDESSWKLWLFNLVDRALNGGGKELVEAPPSPRASPRIGALVASTVESLCRRRGWPAPVWCEGVPALTTPWFPSETESLKATALVESPAAFRRRNIFVLGNFLERA